MKVPLTYIAGPFSATLRDDKYLDFFEPGAKVPVLSTVVPPELQKDLLLVFIPVKESFEILKIHTPPSSIQGGDHYVINATATDVAIKFGTAKPVLISRKGRRFCTTLQPANPRRCRSSSGRRMGMNGNWSPPRTGRMTCASAPSCSFTRPCGIITWRSMESRNVWTEAPTKQGLAKGIPASFAVLAPQTAINPIMTAKKTNPSYPPPHSGRM